MRWQDSLVVDPNICHGRPCYRGTRIPVTVVLDSLAAGIEEAELRREYPSLPPEAVRVALSYAADR